MQVLVGCSLYKAMDRNRDYHNTERKSPLKSIWEREREREKIIEFRMGFVEGVEMNRMDEDGGMAWMTIVYY